MLNKIPAKQNAKQIKKKEKVLQSALYVYWFKKQE